eukprot:scaffold16867_cov67-Phaeocystis_antarctica.AAC.3
MGLLLSPSSRRRGRPRPRASTSSSSPSSPIRLPARSVCTCAIDERRGERRSRRVFKPIGVEPQVGEQRCGARRQRNGERASAVESVPRQVEHAQARPAVRVQGGDDGTEARGLVLVERQLLECGRRGEQPGEPAQPLVADGVVAEVDEPERRHRGDQRAAGGAVREHGAIILRQAAQCTAQLTPLQGGRHAQLLHELLLLGARDGDLDRARGGRGCRRGRECSRRGRSRRRSSGSSRQT